MLLVLELEDAVHDQYEHAARFVAGEEGDLVAREAARARALAVTHPLTERMAGGGGCGLGAADPRRDGASSAACSTTGPSRARTARPPRSPAAHDPSYAVVLLIEESIHEYFGRMQAATSAFRQQLVALERSAMRRTALLLVAIPALVAAPCLPLALRRAAARAAQRGRDRVAGEPRHDRIATPDEFGALAAKFNR